MRNYYALLLTIAVGGTLLTGCTKAEGGKVAPETTPVATRDGTSTATSAAASNSADGATGSSGANSARPSSDPKSSTPAKATNPDGSPANSLRSANAAVNSVPSPETTTPAKSFESKDVVGKWRLTDNDGFNNFGVLELNADGSFSMNDKNRGIKSSSGIWKVGVDQVAIVMSIVNGAKITSGDRMQVTIAPDGKSMYGDKRRFERMAK